MKKWHHDIEVPRIAKIFKPPQRPAHFLDSHLKSKKDVPPPTTYNIDRDLKIRQNPMYSKSPRVTYAAEIDKKEKGRKSPPPGAYTPGYKITE